MEKYIKYFRFFIIPQSIPHTAAAAIYCCWKKSAKNLNNRDYSSIASFGSFEAALSASYVLRITIWGELFTSPFFVLPLSMLIEQKLQLMVHVARYKRFTWTSRHFNIAVRTGIGNTKPIFKFQPACRSALTNPNSFLHLPRFISSRALVGKRQNTILIHAALTHTNFTFLLFNSSLHLLHELHYYYAVKSESNEYTCTRRVVVAFSSGLITHLTHRSLCRSWNFFFGSFHSQLFHREAVCCSRILSQHLQPTARDHFNSFNSEIPANTKVDTLPAPTTNTQRNCVYSLFLNRCPS